jgi:hypothetical protein
MWQRLLDMQVMPGCNTQSVCSTETFHSAASDSGCTLASTVTTYRVLWLTAQFVLSAVAVLQVCNVQRWRCSALDGPVLGSGLLLRQLAR